MMNVGPLDVHPTYTTFTLGSKGATVSRLDYFY